MSRESLFALYRGDEFVDVGTKKELAERMGVRTETIGFLASPTNARRNRSGDRLMAYRIEEDEDDE